MDNTGSHVEYGCVRGYVLQDPTQSGLDCQNGVWTGIWPICGKCTIFEVGLAPLIKISVNWSIYNRKTIIDMKIQKSVTFNGCSVLFGSAMP